MAPWVAGAAGPFRLGLTPVFLDNDAMLLDALGKGLSEALGFGVEFEQRRTYEEVTGLLLQGAVDAAWLCGFPYLQHESELAVVAVPLWLSDPDSNSGYLVTVTDLIRMGEAPGAFFGRTIFTYGHRNVVRAVASGLTRSGSVDGYVWEALARRETALTRATKVIARSEWLGFPPLCARRDQLDRPRIAAFRDALLSLDQHESGRQALDLLQLDGLTRAPAGLFDGIAARMRDLDGPR